MPSPNKSPSHFDKHRVKGAYAALLLATLPLAVKCSYDAITARMNPDTRSIRQNIIDTLHNRRIVCEECTGDVDESTADRYEEPVKCLLQRMGMMESKSPPEGVPREIWESNNETRDEYIKVQFEPGTPPVRFSYWPNLFGHQNDNGTKGAVSSLKGLAQHPEWAGQLGWLYEGFKKEYPNLSESEETEAWEKYVTEAYLGQRLVCPTWEDGSCMKSWDGLTKEDVAALHEAQKNGDVETVKEIRSKARDCLLVAPAAYTVTLANRLVYNDHNQEIEPMTCYRSNPQQTVLAVTIGYGGKCDLKRKPDGLVQNPGQSAHNRGVAMDVYNKELVEPYLSYAGGWQCSFVGKKTGKLRKLGKIGEWISAAILVHHKGDDDSHCSIGEFGATPEAAKYKQIIEAPLTVKPWFDGAKKAQEIILKR